MNKLHLGCGITVLHGWINTDLYPQSNDIIYLDVTDPPYPVIDEDIDYIFQEHLIEHLTYEQGSVMLNECYRIMKPNGKIRISTPDLQFLIDLYSQESKLHKEYINWASKDLPYNTNTFVINNYVRAWGHKFIYDKKTLHLLLKNTGFIDITEHKLNESNDKEFRNLENESKYPPNFLQLETFTLEAKKG